MNQIPIYFNLNLDFFFCYDSIFICLATLSFAFHNINCFFPHFIGLKLSIIVVNIVKSSSFKGAFLHLKKEKKEILFKGGYFFLGAISFG